MPSNEEIDNRKNDNKRNAESAQLLNGVLRATLGGVLGGASIFGAQKLMRYLREYKKQFADKKDTSWDDDTLYINLGTEKQAMDLSPTGLIKNPLLMHIAALLAGGASTYYLLNRGDQVQRRRELQSQIDEAQQAYITALSSPKDISIEEDFINNKSASESSWKQKASDVLEAFADKLDTSKNEREDSGMGIADVATGFPSMVFALAALAAGYAGYKYMNKQDPVVSKKNKTPRINKIIISSKNVKDSDPKLKEEWDGNNEYIFQPEFEEVKSAAYENVVGAVLGMGSKSSLPSVINALASGGYKVVKSAAQNTDTLTFCSLIDNSCKEAKGFRKISAIRLAIQDPDIRDHVMTLATSELFDRAPNLLNSMSTLSKKASFSELMEVVPYIYQGFLKDNAVGALTKEAQNFLGSKLVKAANPVGASIMGSSIAEMLLSNKEDPDVASLLDKMDQVISKLGEQVGSGANRGLQVDRTSEFSDPNILKGSVDSESSDSSIDYEDEKVEQLAKQLGLVDALRKAKQEVNESPRDF